MEKKQFDLLIKNLDSLLTRCVQLKEEVDKTKLQDRSVKDYNQLVEKASCLQGEQDKLNTSDLYHILGMGNLSVTQQATFISKLKEVLDTRPTIKFVASQPKIKVGQQSKTHEYVCALLSGQKLKA